MGKRIAKSLTVNGETIVTEAAWNEELDAKHEKLEKNEIKEHKDAKHEKFEKNEIKEQLKIEIKEHLKAEVAEKPPSFEGPLGPGQPGLPDPGPLAGQQHFIAAEHRPDLSRGALKDEPDTGAGAAGGTTGKPKA